MSNNVTQFHSLYCNVQDLTMQGYSNCNWIWLPENNTLMKTWDDQKKLHKNARKKNSMGFYPQLQHGGMVKLNYKCPFHVLLSLFQVQALARTTLIHSIDTLYVNGHSLVFSPQNLVFHFNKVVWVIYLDHQR